MNTGIFVDGREAGRKKAIEVHDTKKGGCKSSLLLGCGCCVLRMSILKIVRIKHAR